MEASPALKIKRDVDFIEASCRIVVETIELVGKNIKSGVSTIELDRIAEDYIRTRGGEPAFKGYQVGRLKFPNTLCISINEEVVHGIPGERVIQNGDLVSIDCGVKKEGFFGDSAFTFPVGEISEENKKLLRITQESLLKGVEQATARNKVYDIGRAVQFYVEKNGFSVVRDLVGHGIGKKLHEEPSVPNFVPPLLHRSQYPNVKLRNGQTIAIEPMVNAGKYRVITAQDGWTVIAADRRSSAHFEHTVVVQEREAIILTLPS